MRGNIFARAACLGFGYTFLLVLDSGFLNDLNKTLENFLLRNIFLVSFEIMPKPNGHYFVFPSIRTLIYPLWREIMVNRAGGL